MTGSSFGKAFGITTFGESHGPSLGVVIQGCPAGVPFDTEQVTQALRRRRPGQGPAGTTRKEADLPRVVSGVFEHQTTGTPITILIDNTDAKPRAYDEISRLYRPGHGDFTYQAKYGIRDYRGGGRASARETAARVAAGAVAQMILDTQGITIVAATVALGGIGAAYTSGDLIDAALDPVFLCPDHEAAKRIEARVKKVKADGDSLGGIVEIVAENVPPGLGEPVFDKLDADLAKALMSIGAVKAVEVGAGTGASGVTGFQNNDAMGEEGFESNNCGGILAGISNGENIVLRAHVKPIPSISRPQHTVDMEGRPREIVTQGRHDICAIPRINPVCQAMTAIVLADHLLRHRGQAKDPIIF